MIKAKHVKRGHLEVCNVLAVCGNLYVKEQSELYRTDDTSVVRAGIAILRGIVTVICCSHSRISSFTSCVNVGVAVINQGHNQTRGPTYPEALTIATKM
ncbi:hypothetical protein DPMN_010852 [Dreissena polymorpha]|uniref:Uncharacterized protein n=1 Tax=Dreissena polymorpha TaxID=45954 RepID=A0A9D4N3X1_DREPO|nr:hypothetical protein DPMN_010852 [Dreissena polymorpha]